MKSNCFGEIQIIAGRVKRRQQGTNNLARQSSPVLAEVFLLLVSCLYQYPLSSHTLALLAVTLLGFNHSLHAKKDTILLNGIGLIQRDGSFTGLGGGGNKRPACVRSPVSTSQWKQTVSAARRSCCSADTRDK